MKGNLNDGQVRKPKSYEVGMQISRSVHTEVPEEDVIRRTEKASWRGVSPIGRAEGMPNRGGAFDA